MTPHKALLGNILLQAKSFKDDAAMMKYQDVLEALLPEMFAGDDLKLYRILRELLDENRAPTAAAVKRLKWPDFSPEMAAKYIVAAEEGDLGEWSSYVEAIEAAHYSRLLTGALSEAQGHVKAGDLAEARNVLAHAVDETTLESSKGLERVVDFSLPEAAPQYLQTPWSRLNEHLGGGFGWEGNRVITLILADSGVGKGTFTQQMLLKWLLEGHYIAYFFGEGQVSDIAQEFARFQAGLGYAELRELGIRQRVPRVLQKYEEAARELKHARGRLYVMDQEFLGEDIRREARRLKRQLLSDIEEGITDKDAKLICVIDNIDSAIVFDNRRFQREDQAYEYEGRRFEQAAKTDGYHMFILSQVNEAGSKRNGAPEMNDIARAKVLKNRAAFIITLHRPITDADKSQMDNGEPGRRARHWVAVRKARGGKVGELEMESNPRTGIWFDPERASENLAF